LATLFIALEVKVSRLYDIGKSRWLLDIVLIPIVGAVWLKELLFPVSNPGVSEFGSSPKEKKPKIKNFTLQPMTIN
jgi:uncharacterized membrane protein YhaH (DUF805 family)